MLINKQYIKSSPKVVKKKNIPELTEDPMSMFQPPFIDMPKLCEAYSKGELLPNNDSFWEINFDRFHQDMR